MWGPSNDFIPFRIFQASNPYLTVASVTFLKDVKMPFSG